MMRKREIRSYSRYSGVKTSPRGRLRAAGLAILVIGGVVGLCGLTTIVAQQTDRLQSSRVAQSDPSASTSATTIAATALSAEAASMLQPIQATSSAKVADSATENEIKDCDESLRTASVHKQSTQLKKESLRHRHALRSLQTTGLITKFLNPYVYGKRANQEATHHKNAVQHIQKTYSANLKKANCDTSTTSQHSQNKG